jgi:hypothetical protein
MKSFAVVCPVLIYELLQSETKECSQRQGYLRTLVDVIHSTNLLQYDLLAAG